MAKKILDAYVRKGVLYITTSKEVFEVEVSSILEICQLKEAAQQSVQPTGGYSSRVQVVFTDGENTAPEVVTSPPTSG